MDESGNWNGFNKCGIRRKVRHSINQNFVLVPCNRLEEGKCRQLNMTVAVISGGLTSMLQPLNVCLNNLLKIGCETNGSSGCHLRIKPSPKEEI